MKIKPEYEAVTGLDPEKTYFTLEQANATLPYVSRVVADVCEAMAAHRPYRVARGIETALAELEAHFRAGFADHLGQPRDPAGILGGRARRRSRPPVGIQPLRRGAIRPPADPPRRRPEASSRRRTTERRSSISSTPRRSSRSATSRCPSRIRTSSGSARVSRTRGTRSPGGTASTSRPTAARPGSTWA